MTAQSDSWKNTSSLFENGIAFEVTFTGKPLGIEVIPNDNGLGAIVKTVEDEALFSQDVHVGCVMLKVNDQFVARMDHAIVLSLVKNLDPPISVTFTRCGCFEIVHRAGVVSTYDINSEWIETLAQGTRVCVTKTLVDSNGRIRGKLASGGVVEKGGWISMFQIDQSRSWVMKVDGVEEFSPSISITNDSGITKIVKEGQSNPTSTLKRKRTPPKDSDFQEFDELETRRKPRIRRCFSPHLPEDYVLFDSVLYSTIIFASEYRRATGTWRTSSTAYLIIYRSLIIDLVPVKYGLPIRLRCQTSNVKSHKNIVVASFLEITGHGTPYKAYAFECQNVKRARHLQKILEEIGLYAGERRNLRQEIEQLRRVEETIQDAEYFETLPLLPLYEDGTRQQYPIDRSVLFPPRIFVDASRKLLKQYGPKPPKPRYPKRILEEQVELNGELAKLAERLPSLKSQFKDFKQESDSFFQRIRKELEAWQRENTQYRWEKFRHNCLSGVLPFICLLVFLCFIYEAFFAISPSIPIMQ